MNGRRSRGPKTPEGKAISSENAVKHGFSGKKLVGKADRPALNRRIEVFSAEAGESALMQGAAGFAALSMTQAEAICESRHLAAEEKSRRIRRKERDREADILEDAEKLLDAGNDREGLARLAEAPRGCIRIGGLWIALANRAAGLPANQAIGPELWAELDRLRTAVAPQERSQLAALLNHARGGNGLLAGQLHSMALTIAAEWEEAAIQLREDWDQALEARLSHARADLGPTGQLRHRYFQSAQSTYRQMVQVIQKGMPGDGMDSPEGPERNEPEDSPQTPEMEPVAETEPGDAREIIARIQGSGPCGTDPWVACPRPRGHGPRPETPARASLAAPDGRAHAHADVGMPPTPGHPPAPSQPPCDNLDTRPRSEAPDQSPAERNEPEDLPDILDDLQVMETEADGDLPNVLTPMMLQAIREDYKGEPAEELAAAIRRTNALLYRNGARPPGDNPNRPTGRLTPHAFPIPSSNESADLSREHGPMEGPSALAIPPDVGDTRTSGSAESEKSPPRPEAPR